QPTQDFRTAPAPSSATWGRDLLQSLPRHPETAQTPRAPHIDMPTIVLSTLALVGCAFLVYAWFCWLREELDLKRPAHRDRRRKMLRPTYMIHGFHRWNP